MKKAQGKYLKFDPKTGKISTAAPEQKSERKITLRLYNLDGVDDEILVTSKVGFKKQGSGFEESVYRLSRGRYKAFLRNILNDPKLVKEILKNQNAEFAHYLAGADEPLARGAPYAKKLRQYFPSDDIYEAESLMVAVSRNVEDEVFHRCATENDKKNLDPIEIVYIDPE